MKRNAQEMRALSPSVSADSVTPGRSSNEQADGSVRIAWCIAGVYLVTCYAAAFRHVMWRDEWQPLVTARDTSGYRGFLEGIRWIGLNGFYSFCWLVQQSGLGIWFFKLVLVAISAYGVFVFCRRAPFSTFQKLLFAFGYFPFYEYGVILRNYGITLTASIVATAIITSRSMHALGFGVCLAVMAQTHTFGLVLSLVFGATYFLELWRRGELRYSFFVRPASVAGLLIAFLSIGVAAYTVGTIAFAGPEWAFAAATGGSGRADSHLVRLGESLVFPARGWLPIPLFGLWNSQLLDPWPWSQVLVGAVMLGWALMVVARSSTALGFVGLGMFGLMALFTHVPWTAMRYHGHFFLVLVVAIWLAEQARRPSAGGGDSSRGILGLQLHYGPAFTALLLVHVIVGAIFTLQEQIVPFSGSREAARFIRENEPPDVLVIGDIDAWMTPLSGYLGRQIYIASRRALGSYVKVDAERRWKPLDSTELGEVVADCLAAERRDVLLVTSYPISIPPEVGAQVAIIDRSVTDERYFMYRIRFHSSRN